MAYEWPSRCCQESKGTKEFGRTSIGPKAAGECVGLFENHSGGADVFHAPRHFTAGCCEEDSMGHASLRHDGPVDHGFVAVHVKKDDAQFIERLLL
jgi:hypothetical protein